MISFNSTRGSSKKKKKSKYKKLPRKPKASASLKQLENYVRKVQEIQKYNAKVTADEKRRKDLFSKIQRFSYR